MPRFKPTGSLYASTAFDSTAGGGLSTGVLSIVVVSLVILLTESDSGAANQNLSYGSSGYLRYYIPLLF